MLPFWITLAIIGYLVTTILAFCNFMSSWKEFMRDEIHLLKWEDEKIRDTRMMALLSIAGPLSLISSIIVSILDDSFSLKFWEIEPDN